MARESERLRAWLARYLQEREEREREKVRGYRAATLKSRTASKRRYNEKNYASVHVHLEKELVEVFRETCKASGRSQADVVREAIEGFVVGWVGVTMGDEGWEGKNIQPEEKHQQ